MAALLVSTATAAEKPQAAIAGSVFRDPGFAFPGVTVHLQPAPPAAASKKVKVKPMKTVSDSRGEFSFRVPAGEMSYTVSFQASGYLEEKKTVTIHGEERQDLFVTMKPDSKETAK